MVKPVDDSAEERGSKHYSVLLNESVSALLTNRSGVYVDATFGRGGHSRAILKELGDAGKLIAFDKDPQAVEVGRELEAEDKRFEVVHDSFANIASRLRGMGIEKVDGLLFDLGVSSPQLDNASRGFSFLNDGPLDMRMDTSKGVSAADWLDTVEENELIRVLREFGEERFARRMAAAVVNERAQEKIISTKRLADIISAANPRWEKGKHPATRAFQAIRIFINSELDDLSAVLTSSIDLMRPGARLVVISFHSLEDRIVKRFIRAQSKGRDFPINVPVTEDMLEKKLRPIGKAGKAAGDELLENIRSRSAVMRVAERLA